jgi:hypothetical protein
MTYEEMLEKIQEDGDVYIQGYDYKPCGGLYPRRGEKVVTGNEYVEVSWVAGGMTGGDCWGGRADRARSAQPPEELRELDKILEILVPNISYLQFKKIDQKVETGVRSGEYEYYGNYTEYAYKTLKLKDLHEALTQMSLI